MTDTLHLTATDVDGDGYTGFGGWPPGQPGIGIVNSIPPGYNWSSPLAIGQVEWVSITAYYQEEGAWLTAWSWRSSASTVAFGPEVIGTFGGLGFSDSGAFWTNYNPYPYIVYPGGDVGPFIGTYSYSYVGSSVDDYFLYGSPDWYFPAGGYAWGGDGNDTMWGRGAFAHLYGQSGDDVLFGTRNTDIIDGGDGNDFLHGNGGPDTVLGGGGDDFIQVAGASHIDAGSGNDVVEGSTYGVLGSELAGGEGFDVLKLYEQDYAGNIELVLADQLLGPVSFGSGTLQGFEKFYVTLGGGNDILDVRNFNHTGSINLGGGDDTIYSDLTATGFGDVRGGEGIDTLYADYSAATGSVGFSGAYVYLDGVISNQFDADIIKFKGGNSDDFLFGGVAGSELFGRGGDDYLTGGGIGNLLDGGSGNDQVLSIGYNATNWLSSGNTLIGGEGNDFVFLTENFHTGDIAFKWTDQRNNPTQFGSSTLHEFESFNLLFGSGNDVFDVSGATIGDSPFRYYYNTHHSVASLGEGNDTLRLDHLTKGNLMVMAGGGLNSLEADFSLSSSAVTMSDRYGVQHWVGSTDLVVALSGYEFGRFDIAGGSAADRLLGTYGDDTLSGNAGADSLDGSSGNDVLNGGEGNDWLNGGSGVNLLLGRAGDDSLGAGGSGSELYGGDGNDTLHGGGVGLLLDGGAGDDQVFGVYGYTNSFSGSNSLIGGDGNDFVFHSERFFTGDIVLNLAAQRDATTAFGSSTLIGFESFNLFFGSGDDVFDVSGTEIRDAAPHYYATNDSVADLGEGDDSLIVDHLTTGNLTVLGGGGLNTLEADFARSTSSVTMSDRYGVQHWVRSADLVVTLSGFEFGRFDIAGGSAADRLLGTYGDDTLTGNAGADSLDGSSGNDVLSGGADDDNLVGGEGNDILNGGAGNDLIFGDGGVDAMSGGQGNDLFSVDHASDKVVELAGQGVDHVYSTVSFALSANVEELTLLDSTNINAIGNSLANVLTGNSGNNSLNGSTGADLMAGGHGNDIYFVDHIGDVVSESDGSGLDRIVSTLSYTLGVGLENLTLSGNAAIDGTGTELDNTITGNSVANTLTGLGGNDMLNGGAGADTMIGGAGNDTYVVDNLLDVVTESANEGTDRVSSSVSYMLSTHIENLALTGTSAINGTGNGLNNAITGNGAANTLTGGGGNDTLNGGLGDDSLIGGLGNDTLVGGVGADRMVFTAFNEGTDTISGFAVGTDKIAIDAAVFGAVVNFVSGPGAATVNGDPTFLYNTTTRILSFDADGNGGGVAVQIARFTTVTALAASDFEVF